MLHYWLTLAYDLVCSIDVFIISLSITDLLTVTTVVPLQIARISADTDWDSFPEALCPVGAYFLTVTICISLFTLVLIAIDR